ncbi:hypothetical protein HSBAA_39470 [Vreelandella sulfidaeris]|uniref:Uncharacterized protein n=1 Tax=Vreelandella sulfidaeris TaxID=115553 RepID=A0A455UDF4_9GAMM|nr:hypothetical protein HSBAA_39470 [Halomonas sulfidaeris]
MTGLFKLLGPLYLVLPGIIAYHLYADQGVRADEAYGHLFNVLPPYLTGFSLRSWLVRFCRRLTRR